MTSPCDVSLELLNHSFLVLQVKLQSLFDDVVGDKSIGRKDCRRVNNLNVQVREVKLFPVSS